MKGKDIKKTLKKTLLLVIVMITVPDSAFRPGLGPKSCVWIPLMYFYYTIEIRHKEHNDTLEGMKK